jgi:integrase
VQRQTGYTIADMLADYWTGHLQHKSSGATGKYSLEQLHRHLGSMPASKLTRADIDQYARTRAKDYRKQDQWLLNIAPKDRPREPRHVSPRAVQVDLKYLSMAAMYAADNSKIPANNISRFCRVSMPEPSKVVLDGGAADGPEWQALYRNCAPHIKTLVLLLYDTGMRLGEALGMQWEWMECIGPGRWVIRIDMPDQGKKKHRRIVPVSTRLLEAILPMKSTGAVFGASGIYKAFRGAVLRSGLPKTVTPNALRRTRASIGDAIDEPACREMLGHTAGDVHTKHYAKVTIDRLFRLVGIGGENAQFSNSLAGE